MIACVLLAAGLSSRFGKPKALAEWGNRTIIEHIQRKLLKTHLSEIIIVLGSKEDEILPHIVKDKKIRTVKNADYLLGQTSSFKTGVKIVSGKTSGIMLMLIDYPNIKIDTIDQLINSFLQKEARILIPTYADRKGHPPLFCISLKEEILSISDSDGINSFSRRHTDDTFYEIVKDPGVCQTFNTLQELEKIKRDSSLDS